jgi:hypothetical protein
MLNSNNSFAIVLLPSQENLLKLNSLKNKLYGPEFNIQPRGRNSDAHITLGIGLQNEDVFKNIETDVKGSNKVNKFNLNYSSIAVQEIKNHGEDYLWVGVIYEDAHLLDLTNFVTNLLHKYDINITDEYDTKLKSIYDESNAPNTLIGNHISLGNRCSISKKEVVKKMLADELPKEILVDRIAIKSVDRNEGYIWLHQLP